MREHIDYPSQKFSGAGVPSFGELEVKFNSKDTLYVRFDLTVRGINYVGSIDLKGKGAELQPRRYDSLWINRKNDPANFDKVSTAAKDKVKEIIIGTLMQYTLSAVAAEFYLRAHEANINNRLARLEDDIADREREIQSLREKMNKIIETDDPFVGEN